MTAQQTALSRTPGPWRSEMRSLYETNIVAGNKVIATIHGEGVGEEAALARLIAAAPTLLKTARRLWDVDSGYSETRDRDLIDAWAELIDAIELAEGRS